MAGAIGKPPPRARRARDSNLRRLSATPHLLPQKERGLPWQRMVEDMPLRCSKALSWSKGLSSVSLTADSSLCGGSLWVALPAKPPLKGEVPATGGRRGSSPAPHVRGGSVSRRGLNQAYWEHTQSQADPPKKKRRTSSASRSSGGSAREGLLSEKPPPSEFLSRYSVTHTAVTWAGRESVMIPLV